MPPPPISVTAPPSGGPPRWLAAVLGVLTILVGIAALVWPGPTLLAIGFLFGIYLAVWGIGLLVRGVGGHDVSIGLRILDIFLGVFAVLAGIAPDGPAGRVGADRRLDPRLLVRARRRDAARARVRRAPRGAGGT